MKIAFLGTPRWAVPSLEALAEAGADIRVVITNPDRRAGRGLDLKAPPVKDAATALSLEVVQPKGGRDPSLQETLASSGVDAAVVVAYGSILPAGVLSSVPKGFVNVHFSLLPEYRGAAPVQRAVMDGRRVSGVSTMLLTEGMDEGPVLGRAQTDVGGDETAGELGDRLARLGAALLVDTLPRYLEGTLTPEEQDHDAATYAPKITTEEARIDWAKTTTEIADLVRGLNPAPGAWTTFRGKRVKIHRARPASADTELDPGEIEMRSDALYAGTVDGALVLGEVQPAGKARMPGEAMARGMRPEQGERFE